ncbi:sodium-coupled monocarboxylate transporter 1-like [Lineus longissimus]|uniref:sodium-coupled monocarboxylate transporter 1-like n=1 Tax=Lineus longissimus TaxID=88925 RepID=UPI002B4F0D65
MALEGPRPTFSPWDYVVFSIMLVISAAIGIFFGCTGGKQRTTKEFLMADRQMGIAPVALSLLASFMSAITLLGTPSEIYVHGTQYLWIVVSYIPVVTASAYIFLPILFKLKLTSAYEYLELRFHRSLRVLGASFFILQMTIYMAIVVYAPSLALNAVTGLNIWASVFSIGLVCTFYTTIGGMKAVMWTDVFQIGMMFAGLLTVLIQGSIMLGGFGEIWRINQEGQRIEFFNFDPDPTARHTVWSMTIGGYFTWVAIYGVNQAQVQRALTVPKLRDAQIAMWINLPGLSLLAILTSMAGMVMYANYKDCDPKRNGDIFSDDQLLPLFVMEHLSFLPGIPGLFVACIFSGALSTVSSGLNSLAAVTLEDIVKLLCFKNLTERQSAIASKILSCSYGVLCLCLTFLVANMGGVLQAALALFGIVGGPILGIFILGMIFPWANWKGGIAGGCTALFVCLWIGIGAQVHKPYVPKPPTSIDGCPNVTLNDSLTTTMMSPLIPLTTINTTLIQIPRERDRTIYSISYMWYSAIAVIITNTVGLIVSFATGATNPKDVDPRLICPIFDTCACYLPRRFRVKLRCGIDFEDRWEKGEKEHELGEVKATELSDSMVDIIDNKGLGVNGGELTNTVAANDITSSRNSVTLYETSA